MNTSTGPVIWSPVTGHHMGKIVFQAGASWVLKLKRWRPLQPDGEELDRDVDIEEGGVYYYFRDRGVFCR